MVEYLKPMHWPRPVPTLWWVGDYADIRERIRRDGYLETEDVWLPSSDDGWRAFVGRHGDYGFNLDWREWNDLIQAGSKAASRRAYEQQEQWEAEQRKRRQELQAQADWEWQQTENARAFWSRIDPVYATAQYGRVTIATTGVIGGVRLEANTTYWVPQTIKAAIREHKRVA